MSTFAADKFAWLRQIRLDRKNLPPSAAWLAITFCDYFNREGGAAWPSIERLARDLVAGTVGLEFAREGALPTLRSRVWPPRPRTASISSPKASLPRSEEYAK
jgi:hypothetical protein